MQTLATILPPRDVRGPKAQLGLREAYMAMFEMGNATQEQRDIVMVDLAKASGYYNTTSPDVSDGALRYAEGQRSIFARILQFMNPPISELTAMRKAVQEETLADHETGIEIQ